MPFDLFGRNQENELRRAQREIDAVSLTTAANQIRRAQESADIFGPKYIRRQKESLSSRGLTPGASIWEQGMKEAQMNVAHNLEEIKDAGARQQAAYRAFVRQKKAGHKAAEMSGWGDLLNVAGLGLSLFAPALGPAGLGLVGQAAVPWLTAAGSLANIAGSSMGGRGGGAGGMDFSSLFKAPVASPAAQRPTPGMVGAGAGAGMFAQPQPIRPSVVARPWYQPF